MSGFASRAVSRITAEASYAAPSSGTFAAAVSLVSSNSPFLASSSFRKISRGGVKETTPLAMDSFRKTS